MGVGMATGEEWSRLEVDACVAVYVQMLALELNGQRFTKSRHVEALADRLDGRSRASIEYKFRNISSVMTELGWPGVTGYKRLDNFQRLLLEVVESRLHGDHVLQAAVQAAVDRPAAAIEVDDALSVWVPIPSPGHHVRDDARDYSPRFSAAKRDYLAREGRNRSLGAAGERLVLELEARRLHAAGKRALSERVEHVSATCGDGLGYDVHSFETDGRDRLIEVKTTAFGELTPFFVSRTELARSVADADCYQLYRVFDFRNKPRVFSLIGAIESRCRLDAVSYLAQLAG